MSNPRSIRPTIKDVARAAGVSQSTVSYILNESRGALRISVETKERVLAAARQLGYRCNPLGRALQRGYSNQVLLLMVTWNLATSHAATAMSLSRAATRRDLAFTVHVAEDDASAEVFVRRTNLHNFGGMLVLWDSPAFQSSSLRQLAGEGLPIVSLLPDHTEGISVVTADREAAGYLGTRHLIDLGHREIGFIGDVESRPNTTLRKLSGYQRALAEAKLTANENLIQNVIEFGFEGGQRGFRALLERAPEMTAVFCINDAIALGAICAAQDFGRECPRELSVIGYGDSAEGRHWRPALTTFELGSDTVAQHAIDSIVRSRSGAATGAANVLLPGDLVPRASTAPRESASPPPSTG